ncbi:SLBB domain-containing protein [Limnohabitans sp. Jir72]|uniref:SLBB domain-containing protein n=1 Tax=Limnohabitans sp. Jir72 TaxID=1977909 RepID=UPI0011B22047|nr:SLBB domain-containing protein [Limnohabitans sp. Jir72]
MKKINISMFRYFFVGFAIFLNYANMSIAQDFKITPIPDIYGVPKQVNPTAAAEGGMESPRQKIDRPNSLYPSLRMNNISSRVTVEPPTVNKQGNKIPSPKEMSDFEIMVQQSLGVVLPVFGRELFDAPASTFNTGDQVNVPSDFVIGPGDELIIRAWGSIELEYAVTVDRQGAIFIPKLGSLPLAGVTYKEVSSIINMALSKIYKGFELNVTMGTLRSIRIYVTGYARSPGTYQINSLNSLISALFMTGGPSSTGDMRRIELRRNGAVTGTIDLYDFLIHGNRQGDMRLQNEDVIHIPSLEGQVAIAGSVRNSAIFQVKAGMTLGDLFQISGGSSSTADGLKLSLERVKPAVISDPSAEASLGQTDRKSNRIIEELTFSPQSMSTVLRDGDLVIVVPLSPQFTNAVTLKGQVALPLRFAWRNGLRISDMLPSASALISPDYWIQRNAETKLASFLTDPAKTQGAPTFPEINWEYAVIERILPESLRVTLIPFELGKAILERDPKHDLILQPGDVITVFSRKEFRGPLENTTRFVKIEGEVRRPGIYPVAQGVNLPQIIEQAGGVTDISYLFGTQLFRESLKSQQQKRIDEAIEGLERDITRNIVDRSRNSLVAEEPNAVSKEADAVKSFLSVLKQKKPDGRMLLELNISTSKTSQLPTIRLENNDVIYIPAVPETVEVVGAVAAQRSFLWRDGRNAEDYIQMAGGRKKIASSSPPMLIRADGSMLRLSFVNNTNVAPGDTIWVEEKEEQVGWLRLIKDWSQIIYQFGFGAAGFKILQGGL